MSDDGEPTVRDLIRDLTIETAALRVVVERQTQQLKWRTRALVASLIVGSAILAALIFVGLDNRSSIAESNRRWCPMVALLIPHPDEAAPTTERGRQIALQALGLWRDFGCGRFTASGVGQSR